MAKPNNRAERMADDQAVIDATPKFFAANVPLPVGSQSLIPADIVKVFQGRIDKARAVLAAVAAVAAAVKDDRDERAQTGPFVRTFIRFVQAAFAESPDTLAAFHVKARKAPQKSAEVKAKAAAKGVAKRKAMSVAKAQIDGTAATPVPPAPKPTA